VCYINHHLNGSSIPCHYSNCQLCFGSFCGSDCSAAKHLASDSNRIPCASNADAATVNPPPLKKYKSTLFVSYESTVPWVCHMLHTKNFSITSLVMDYLGYVATPHDQDANLWSDDAYNDSYKLLHLLFENIIQNLPHPLQLSDCLTTVGC
jgi:hypothetical protein